MKDLSLKCAEFKKNCRKNHLVYDIYVYLHIICRVINRCMNCSVTQQIHACCLWRREKGEWAWLRIKWNSTLYISLFYLN